MAGTRSNLGWSALTIFRRMPLTSWRCGRRRLSIAPQIDKELGWAEGLGMNTMRVFLHDLLWKQDAAGFTRRIDAFLTIADKHHIHPIFVLFDSCWEAEPKLGPQHPPIPGVHNSGWVQSPGQTALKDRFAISAAERICARSGGRVCR